MIKRHKTRAVWIGKVKVGGGVPVSVQSMTKTKTEDIKSTVRQIRELEDLGCQIIRLAIPRMSSAQAISKIKKQIHIPIEADIHFNPELALEVIKQGVNSVRLNPGNTTNKDAIREVVAQAKKREIPIRVGLNSGSVWGYKGKTGNTMEQKLVACAIEFSRFLESLKFRDIMVSLKASDVVSTINAYRLIAQKTDYPLHLGVTAAGPLNSSIIKSAIGIGSLLADGIGDTIRVSITGTPHDEVRIGHEILESLGLAKRRKPEIIACPTCGRCEIDIVKIVKQVESLIKNPKSEIRNPKLKIAIMGCVVNGPGEAREADIGIAGGKDFAFLFKHGKRIRKVPSGKIVPEFIKEIKKL
ncbi:MAG: flavodoxin-dependent (E)-4-hydroxy-3-methylbut-2-enyl-diphosphate synthase [Planctomycetes bacterium]|nr:flavodoxin-dependent (E)-4-hydroxy-3-methylbut-2-enyl-diphosphate synthase [Planctomycetota bacterium]